MPRSKATQSAEDVALTDATAAQNAEKRKTDENPARRRAGCSPGGSAGLPLLVSRSTEVYSFGEEVGGILFSVGSSKGNTRGNAQDPPSSTRRDKGNG